MLSRAEKSVAGVTKSGKNVPVLVEFAIEAGREHRDVGMFCRQPSDTFRRGDQAEEANARRTCTLE